MIHTPAKQDKFIQNLYCGTIVFDKQDRVVFMNSTAKTLLGLTKKDVLGFQLGELLDIPIDSEMFPREAEDVKDVFFTMDGKQFVYRAEMAPLFEEDGAENGRILTIQNITSIQRLKLQLTKEKQQSELAIAQAEMAAQVKASFFNAINHEVRTPLGAVIGMSNLLRDTPLNSEQLELVNTIISNSDDLLLIINNILEFSRIEGNELELDNQPFDLRDSVKISMKPFLEAAAEKSLPFHYHVSEDTPNIFFGDPVRLQQILVSLLKNAIKYTENGSIFVNISNKTLTDGRVELLFSIKDSGIGISKSNQQNLFQPFTQAGSYLTRKYGGTGLGLAISRGLCELMGGNIWVESEEGVGSTFYFTIILEESKIAPKRYLQPQTPTLRGKRLLIIAQNAEHRRTISRETRSAGMSPYVAGSPSEVSYWLKRASYDLAIIDANLLGTQTTNLITYVNELRPKLPIILLGTTKLLKAYLNNPRIAALLKLPVITSNLYEIFINVLAMRQVDKPTKNQFNQKTKLNDMGKRHPLKLLMIEDNPINQKVASRLLERLGYKLDIAQNGVEGLHAINQNSYDVVLMDIQMPVMDGLEATRHIRRDIAESQQPRIIAVTAHAMEGDRVEYLEAGMDDYISKPMKLDALVAALHKCEPRPS